MLAINTETMLIELTRGDTASIVFSAKDKDGTTYTPSTGDKLKFAVAKKVGAEPIFEIETEKTASNTADDFWTIIIPSATTNEMKFGDYAYDVQLSNSSGVDTIIGKTDDISPTFRVWGEVATE